MDKFTPLFDSVIAEHDLITAVVYGFIWRQCQLKNGCCEASFQTIADTLGLGRSTIIRRMAVLIEAGLVCDTTPNAGRKIHKYLVSERHQTSVTVILDDNDASIRETLEKPHLVSERHQTSVTVNHKDTRDNKIETEPSPIEELFEHFLETSHCRRPNGNTTPDEMKIKWWEPLVTIYQASGNSFDNTKERITAAIQHMREIGLTIANPGSIQNTAVSIKTNSRLEIKAR